MKKLLIALVLLCGSVAAQTWGTPTTANTASCGTASTTCSITISSSTAGNVALVQINTAAAQANDIHITGVTMGAGNNFTLCPSSECYASSTVVASEDSAYMLSTPSGQTNVTVTINAAPSTGNWSARVTIYACTGGCSPVYDKGGSFVMPSGSTTCTAPTLTLTGSNDIIQSSCSGTLTSVASPYTFINTAGQTNVGYTLNTSSNTPAAFTAASARRTSTSIAISSGSGGGTSSGSFIGGPTSIKGPVKVQ
jgi:hypothetical protein